MGDTAASMIPSRRGFLGIAAAAAGSALLAGCEDVKPTDSSFQAQSAKATPHPVVDATTALNTVLAVEHQAIFTYTTLAPLLTNAGVVSEAAEFRADHEAHRDALSTRIQGLGGTPVAAKPSYDLTPAPTDQPGALTALAAVEGLAAKTGYSMIAGSQGPEVRTFLMSIMAAEAQHSAIILAAGGQEPIGVPFQTG
jgi:bacterioferritin (cytochrome b1)